MGDLTDLAKRWSSVPRIYSVKVSGDGKWVFWAWEARHETAEIYAVLADGSGVPERLTFGSDHFYLRDVNFDGSRLIVDQSKNGSEHDKLLLLDRANGNALTALTPPQSNHYVYGGRFGLGAEWIIFIADFDYETGQVTEGGWIYRQDLATGERRVLLKTKSTFTEGPELSPDRKNLLWKRHELHPGGDQIWLMGTEGNDPRELLNLGPKARISAEWLDDRRIAFVASGLTRDRVGVVEVGSGTIRPGLPHRGREQ